MCNNSNQRVWLMCPYCDQEQEIPMVAQIHECNCCGAYLAPCSLCNLDTCDCASCEFAKQCEQLNEKREHLLFDAISYVAKNVDKVGVIFTFHNMLLLREPLFRVNANLCDKIYDLMEEYGQDHELAEGWWLNYYDEEIVFEKVYDFINH